MRRLPFFYILFFFMILVGYPSTALADSYGVSNRVEVNHVANILEKFQERVTLFLKFSNEDKASHKQYLVEKRLAELKYVVDTKKWDLIEETSSRYATYLGNFTNFTVENNLKEKKGDLVILFANHSKILEELQKNFEFESGFWLLLQHDINSTKIFTTQVTDNL